MPSKKDLSAYLVYCTEYSKVEIILDSLKFVRVINFPLDCIGGIRDRGRIYEILVFQNRSPNFSEFDAGHVYGYLEQKLGRRIDDNYAVAEALDNLPNWNAALIKYGGSNGFYKILEDDLSKLEKFEYTPKITKIKISFKRSLDSLHPS